MNNLWQIDTQLFLFINHLPHNLSLNLFFGLITALGYLGFIWFVIGILHFIYKKRGSKKILKALFLSIVFSLLFSECLIKNLFQRLRPQFVIPTAIVPYDLVKSFSFPSGHATFAFAAAYILAKKDRIGSFFYYLLATLIAFSRIYLGKHYPSDIIAGIILGLILGFLSLKIVNFKRHD